jgi:hypothetical protein
MGSTLAVLVLWVPLILPWMGFSVHLLVMMTLFLGMTLPRGLIYMVSWGRVARLLTGQLKTPSVLNQKLPSPLRAEFQNLSTISSALFCWFCFMLNPRGGEKTGHAVWELKFKGQPKNLYPQYRDKI